MKIFSGNFLFVVAFALFVALMMLPGCGSVERVADATAKTVSRYCAQPLAERQFIRATVNQAAAPNTVHIHCAGDPEGE